MVDTKLFTIHILLHIDAKGRVFDAIARKKLSQVFVIEFDPLGRLAEGKAVVLDGVFIVNRGKLVDFEFDTVTNNE